MIDINTAINGIKELNDKLNEYNKILNSIDNKFLVTNFAKNQNILALYKETIKNNLDQVKQWSSEVSGILSNIKLDQSAQNIEKQVNAAAIYYKSFNGIKEEMELINELYKQQIKYAETLANEKINKGTDQAAAKQEEAAAKQEEAAAKQEEARKKETEAEEKAGRAYTERIHKILDTIKTVSSTINNFINSIIASIRKVLTVINTVFSSIVSVFNNIKNVTTRLITLFGNFGRGLESVLNNETVKLGENLYQSILSLSNIVGTELTRNTIEWANHLKEGIGLSAKGLISDINELSGVIYGLGIDKSKVGEASENILAMGNYLAFTGLAGGDATTAVNKLTSGLMGMTRAVSGLGIDIRENAINAWLTSLKKQGGAYKDIVTDLSKLNSEQRVNVEYAYIMKEFIENYNISNFTDLLNTSTGKLTQIRNLIKDLRITIGQLFNEIIGKYGNYIIYLTSQVTKLVNYIGTLMGFDLNMSEDSNNASKVVNDLNDNLGDTEDKLKDIDDASKKATKSLFGFDKVTKLSNNQNDNDTSLFDYSSLYDLINGGGKYSIAGLLEEQAKEANNRIKSIGETFEKEIAKRINGFSFAGLKSAFANDDLFAGFYENAEGTWKNILGIVNSVGRIARTIWNDIIKPLIADLGNFLKVEFLPWLEEKMAHIADWLEGHHEQIVKLIETVGSVAWKSFKVFVDLVIKLVEFIAEHPNVVIGFFAGLIALKVSSWFLNAASSIGLFIMGLSGIGASLGPILAVVAGVTALIATIGLLVTHSEKFRESLSNAFNKVKEAFSGLADKIKDTSIFKFIQEHMNDIIWILEEIASVLVDTLGTALIVVIDLIGEIIRVVDGLIQFILGVVTLDGKKIIEGILSIGEGIINIVGDIVLGVKQGFREGWDEAWKDMKEGLHNFVQKIKDFLGIHSPSTVFADIGRNIIQGLIGGIKDKFGELSKLMTDLKNIIVNKFSNALTSVGNSLKGTLSIEASSVKPLKFAGFRASGGVIPRGSVVVGNEGGNLEMYGQLPGGQSVAVNNKMITDSIKGAVYEAMVSAMSMNQLSGSGDVHIHNDGLTIYDDSTLDKLARILEERGFVRR